MPNSPFPLFKACHGNLRPDGDRGSCTSQEMSGREKIKLFNQAEILSSAVLPLFIKISRATTIHAGATVLYRWPTTTNKSFYFLPGNDWAFQVVAFVYSSSDIPKQYYIVLYSHSLK